MYHQKTIEAAKGKWRGVLMALGLPEKSLVNRHGPCPMCGGKDRFRFDNKMGSGSWICSACGAGDGMELAKQFTGMEFKDVASKIDSIIGNLKPDSAQHVTGEMSDDDRRLALRKVYAETKQLETGDLGDVYLQYRGIWEHTYPSSLRYADKLLDGQGGLKPCLVAMVVDVNGKPCSMHRTFLADDGKGKALMESPRKMMPGTLPKGACIRLSDGDVPEHVGIAEGVETAMSACNLFDLPVWSVVNTSLMERWEAPEGVKAVTIFVDSDENFAGHKAAYALAHKLSLHGILVDLQFPGSTGDDFNDVLVYQRRANKQYRGACS